MKLPEMIDKYVQIRDAKAKAKKAFDTEVKRMSDALVKLEGMILDSLNNEGADSIKTEHGTAFKKSRSSCTVKDRDAFYQFAVDTENLEAIDMKANAKVVRELMQEGIDIPGVNYSESIQVGVRRVS